MYSLRLFDAVLLPSFPHTRGDVLLGAVKAWLVRGCLEWQTVAALAVEREPTNRATGEPAALHIQGQAVFVPKFHISGRRAVGVGKSR